MSCSRSTSHHGLSDIAIAHCAGISTSGLEYRLVLAGLVATWWQHQLLEPAEPNRCVGSISERSAAELPPDAEQGVYGGGLVGLRQ